MIKLVAPLRVLKNKSKMEGLNLNIYRNTNHFTLNTMKKNFKIEMADQINLLPTFNKVSISYTLYPKTRRLCDIANILTIIDKFFCDALVETGHIEEDNYLYIPQVIFNMGEVDKDKPRCEIIIKEIK